MLRIATRTKLSPEETVNKAVEFFGPEGYKLEVTDLSETCATFEGGGGSVEVSACAEDKGSSVEFISHEWDYQVKEFIRKIS